MPATEPVPAAPVSKHVTSGRRSDRFRRFPKHSPGEMRLRKLLILLSLFAALAVVATARAQAPAAPGGGDGRTEAPGEAAPGQVLRDAGLSPAAVDELIATLENPEARERLLSNLKGLRAAVSPEAASPEPKRLGGRIVEALSRGVDNISHKLVAGATLMLDAPRLIGWLESQISVPENRDIWLRVLWKVLIVLAAGFAVEWAVRLMLARPRRSIEAQVHESLWVRLPFLAARTLLDVVQIAAFAAAAYVVMTILDPSPITRLIAISLVNASVVARAIVAAARLFFAPRAANLRLVPISGENANYIMVWVRRLTNVSVYGYFLSEAVLLLGMPEGGYVALSKAIGLLVALLVVIFILQNRQVVARWIRGPDTAAFSGLRVLRRRFSEIWHVLAVVYVAAVYLVWLLEIEGGFDFVFQATVLSFVVLIVAKLLILAAHKAVNRGFGLRPELMEEFPGLAARANRYFALVQITLTGVIVFLAIFAVLEAWGLDSFSWIDTPVGRRVVGSVITSAVIIVVAVVFWEIVSSAIERYLSRGENGDVEISARAKTLLPLLRKALLIVVTTIVGFIILSEIGVNIGPLLAGAGVVGLAIGFGSQTLVKDVITGVFILAENQFAVGDVIRVSDKAGLCEDITIRTIRLRDLAGNVHIIPFSSVTTVENMTKDFSRYVFDVGVAYREDVDEVVEVLRGIGAEMQAEEYYGELINEPLEILGLDRFGDSAIVIKARITTKPIRQWEVGREFNRRMKRKFDELGIEIPFPHQTVYFGENKGGGAPPAYVRIGVPPSEGGADGGIPPEPETR